jgi:predicted ArsR family transcriptional regulator
MKPTPDFKWEDLDRVRQATGLDVDDPCPERSFTAAEYQEKYGLKQTTARFQLNRLVAEGRLRCGRKWVENKRGHRQLVQCFWIP